MSARRVVITGMGLASPLGLDLSAVEARLRRGDSGIVEISDWARIGQLNTRVGGAVEGVEFRSFPRRKVRTMGRVALLAAHASDRAVEQAGLSEDLLRSGRCGLSYGSTHGSSSEFEAYCRVLFAQDSFAGVMGSQFLKFMSHTCAANLAEYFGVRGRVQPTCSACTSGSQAIGLAYEYIRDGAQDLMICGGAEELHFTHAGVFDIMYAASTHFNATPERTPRPFDAQRDGVVTGEGAGTLVLETLESAQARGADILAEIIGYGTNCDGLHLTNPSARGMAECMRLALDSASIAADAVDYVNAHGTGTELGDIAESRATLEVMGDKVPVSTQKSLVGHTLGASGALESVFTLQMMRGSFLAGNRNLDQVDERCAGPNFLGPGEHAATLGTAMNNNFAFGGINTSIIYRAWSGGRDGS